MSAKEALFLIYGKSGSRKRKLKHFLCFVQEGIEQTSRASMEGERFLESFLR